MMAADTAGGETQLGGAHAARVQAAKRGEVGCNARIEHDLTRLKTANLAEPEATLLARAPPAR